jgi:hypothetical protein
MAPAACPVAFAGSESEEDDDGDDALHAASEAARAKTTSEENLAEVVSMKRALSTDRSILGASRFIDKISRSAIDCDSGVAPLGAILCDERVAF